MASASRLPHAARQGPRTQKASTVCVAYPVTSAATRRPAKGPGVGTAAPRGPCLLLGATAHGAAPNAQNRKTLRGQVFCLRSMNRTVQSLHVIRSGAAAPCPFPANVIRSVAAPCPFPANVISTAATASCPVPTHVIRSVAAAPCQGPANVIRSVVAAVSSHLTCGPSPVVSREIRFGIAAPCWPASLGVTSLVRGGRL